MLTPAEKMSKMVSLNYKLQQFDRIVDEIEELTREVSDYSTEIHAIARIRSARDSMRDFRMLFSAAIDNALAHWPMLKTISSIENQAIYMRKLFMQAVNNQMTVGQASHDIAASGINLHQDVRTLDKLLVEGILKEN